MWYCTYAGARLFVFYILRWEKVMNMHKAKHYTQVTCLTRGSAANNCTRQISLSLMKEGGRERGVISWEHFSTVWIKNQHTNDADTYTQRSTKQRWLKHRHKYSPNCLHTKHNQPNKTVCQHFFSKCISGGCSECLPSFPAHLKFVVTRYADYIKALHSTTES